MFGTGRCERVFIYVVCASKRTPTYCGPRSPVNKKTRTKSHRIASGPKRPRATRRNYRSEATRREKRSVRGVRRSSAGVKPACDDCSAFGRRLRRRRSAFSEGGGIGGG